MEQNIKIAVYGQIGSDTRMGYTYPDPFDPARFSARDEWIRSIYDPRDDVRSFGGNRFYALWKAPIGNYYATIVPNPLDPRAGWLMLVIFTGRNVVTSGRVLVDAFARLEPVVLNLATPVNPAIVSQVVANLSKSLSPDPGKPFTGTLGLRGYRTYATAADVELFLEWPNQTEYERYRRILLVPASGAMQTPPQGFVPMMSPIKKTYTIYASSQEVSVDRTLLEQGDMLTITYRRNGYLPETRQLVLNDVPNSLVTYDGPRVYIKSPDEVGITFVRGIKIVASDGKNNISGMWVEVDGKMLQQRGNLYIMPDDRDAYPVTIHARGYKTASAMIMASHFSVGNVRVTLHKEELAKARQGGKSKTWLWILLTALITFAASFALFWFVIPHNESEPTNKPVPEDPKEIIADTIAKEKSETHPPMNDDEDDVDDIDDIVSPEMLKDEAKSKGEQSRHDSSRDQKKAQVSSHAEQAGTDNHGQKDNHENSPGKNGSLQDARSNTAPSSASNQGETQTGRRGSSD